MACGLTRRASATALVVHDPSHTGCWKRPTRIGSTARQHGHRHANTHAMDQEQQQRAPDDDESGGSAQQQQQPQPEGHAGQGSESIMKQLREWEDRRASHSGGKRRPNAH
jgi:hypothetical protein